MDPDYANILILGLTYLLVYHYGGYEQKIPPALNPSPTQTNNEENNHGR